MLHGGTAGSGQWGLQNWTSASPVLSPGSQDEGWSQDRAATQHVPEMRGLLCCGLRNAL